jgi:uncharacterized protein YbdZ (MbtH family)
MQLSGSIFCLIFLCGVHFGVCTLRGEIGANAVEISPDSFPGDIQSACLVSTADVPAGWVVTETHKSTASVCPNAVGGHSLISVKMANLNGAEPGSTKKVCLPFNYVLPDQWVITKVLSGGACDKVNNVFYASATIKYVAEENLVDACISSVNNIPAGWVATSVGDSNANCPNVYQSMHYSKTTLKRLGSGTINGPPA